MNNRPPISSSSTVISSYRKRRQRNNMPYVYIIAGVLAVGGIGLLIYWLAGASSPVANLFATETPTPTMTYTPTSTSTPTSTPTATATFTATMTPTFSVPFNYTVQDGDYLALIVEKYNLGDDGVALILLLNPYNPETDTGVDPTTQNIVPGEVILLPNPGMKLPTATTVPADLARGTKEDYIVQSGDTLAAIAAVFNTTEDDIIKANNIEDPNALFVGQVLVIPVNMVTATSTRPPTSTTAPLGPGTELPTTTFTPIN